MFNGKSPFAAMRNTPTFGSSRSSSYSSGFGNGWHSPLWVDVNGLSGFAPLRSPSRLSSIDSVQHHLRNVYREQVKNAADVWRQISSSSNNNNVEKINNSPFQNSNQDDERWPFNFDPDQITLFRADADEKPIKNFCQEIAEISEYKRRLRIFGEFGAGKTSLLYQIIWEWCRDESTLRDRFPILLFLRAEYILASTSFEDALRTILPPGDLRYVVRVLQDSATQKQCLIILDDCQKFSHTTNFSEMQNLHTEDIFDENRREKYFYNLDGSRLLRNRLFPDATVLCAQRATLSATECAFGGKNGDTSPYADYFIFDGQGSQNILLRTLCESSNFNNNKYDLNDDSFFTGVEKAVTKILARTSRPSHLDHSECIQLLGWLCLLANRDELPPLTWDSTRKVDRLEDRFQNDERLREDADDFIFEAQKSGLLIGPGVGRRTIFVEGGYGKKVRHRYILTFAHQSFGLYLAARTFVTLNLEVDWSRIRVGNEMTSKRINSYGEYSHYASQLQNFNVADSLFSYFLTGVDKQYAESLLLRSVNRDGNIDRSIFLPWIEGLTASSAAIRSIAVLADEDFTIYGVSQPSDTALLNKISLDFRSQSERVLIFDNVFLSNGYKKYRGAPLTTLRFRHCRIFDDFFATSSETLFEKVTSWEFIDCVFSDNNAIRTLMNRFSHSKNSNGISCLKINKCQQLLENEDFMRFLFGERCQNLHTLQLADVRDSEKAGNAAFALADSLISQDAKSNIKCLDLRRNAMAPLILPYLTRMPLDELDLSECKNIDFEAWRRFAEELSRPERPLRATLRTVRLDDVRNVQDMADLIGKSLQICDRLKLISVKNCFARPQYGQRFKDDLRSGQNANGFKRDVIL